MDIDVDQVRDFEICFVIKQPDEIKERKDSMTNFLDKSSSLC